MEYFITILFLGYLAGIMVYAHKTIIRLESDLCDQLSTMEGELKDSTAVKDDLDKKKMELEHKAREIFTLYELTKDITKTLREEEIFSIFKEKLNQFVDFKECQFFAASAEKLSEIEQSHAFVFTLQERNRDLAYLAVREIREQDKEKMKILGHQLALALRRVKLYQEIEKTAITDGLTGLHTRRHILERLKEELNRSRARKIKMSFLMIDADFFKGINDQYGHLTGDQILRELAVIIKQNIREIDIAGRYGGEEFCVLLPDTDQEGAKFAAERIRQAAEAADIKVYDINIKITLSAGLATFPEDAKNIEQLIDKADTALYKAKQQGRNRVC